VNTVDVAFSMKLSSNLWSYQMSEQGNVYYVYSDVICCCWRKITTLTRFTAGDF